MVRIRTGKGSGKFSKMILWTGVSRVEKLENRGFSKEALASLEILSLLPANPKLMKINYKYWIVIIPILSLIAFLFFSDHPVNLDEGSTLNVAWQLWFGKHIFKDFYEFTSPGAGILIFSVWKLFSATYLSAKLFSITLFIASTLLLLASVKRTGHNLSWLWSSFVLLSWLVFVHSGPLINHNSFSSFAAILFMYLGILILNQKRLSYFIFLGLSCALVFFFLQTKGLVLLLPSLYLVLSVKTLRGKVYSGIAYLISFALPVLTFLYTLGFKESIQSLFIQPRTIGYMDSTFFQPWLAIVCVIVSILMFAAYYAFRNKYYLFLALLQLSLFIGMLYNFDVIHFLINAFPIIMFIPIITKDLHLGKKKYYFLRNILVFQFICLSLATILVNVTENIYFLPNIFSGKNSAMSDIGSKITGTIYAGPFLPGMPFELGQENKYALYNNMIYCKSGCQSQVINLLKKDPPEYAFMNYELMTKYHYKKNEIDSYFTQNYQKCQSIYGLEVFASGQCPKLSQ